MLTDTLLLTLLGLDTLELLTELLSLLELKLELLELYELHDELLLELDRLEMLDTLDWLLELTLELELELALELLDSSSIDSTAKRSPLRGPGNCNSPVLKLSSSG